MATAAATDAIDGPVLSLVNKRLRALRKKQNRILQLEESIAQGKTVNKEQEEFLRSKPSVFASIDELEKLRPLLSAAVQEELSLAGQPQPVSSVPEDSSDGGDSVLKDLLNLLYFGSLFDVKPQSDFTSTMLTRTHERGCCLTYDYVTDEATDLLGEGDLDLISALSGLLVSRPVDSNLSHKSALHRCFEHAKLWLARSDQPIDQNSGVTYAALRERLNKIMASDYFIATPEMKAPVDVAAASNYVPFQVQVTAPEEEVGSGTSNEHKEEDEADYQERKSDYQENPVEETAPSVDEGAEDSADTSSVQPDQANQQVEVELSQREWEDSKADEQQQQYHPRRQYQNQRGGRGGGGGGRRGFYGGRGGRSGGRGGGAYQNGRQQYQDQPGSYYPRNNYYNSRGRGGRGGGHSYYNDGYNSAGRGGGRGPVDVGMSS